LDAGTGRVPSYPKKKERKPIPHLMTELRKNEKNWGGETLD